MTTEENARNLKMEPPSAPREVSAFHKPWSVMRDHPQATSTLSVDMERLSLAPSEPRDPDEPSVEPA